jgi:circadian clock protein KaiC
MKSVVRFTTGIPGLDVLLGEIAAPYTLLIAGHPGAGKTTVATTICYANALRGRKCLYMSFYEDREKYYRFMKHLGIDLEAVEAKGLYINL